MQMAFARLATQVGGYVVSNAAAEVGPGPRVEVLDLAGFLAASRARLSELETKQGGGGLTNGTLVML